MQGNALSVLRIVACTLQPAFLRVWPMRMLWYMHAMLHAKGTSARGHAATTENIQPAGIGNNQVTCCY